MMVLVVNGKTFLNSPIDGRVFLSGRTLNSNSSDAFGPLAHSGTPEASAPAHPSTPPESNSKTPYVAPMAPLL